jgi:hypothetical protein
MRLLALFGALLTLVGCDETLGENNGDGPAPVEFSPLYGDDDSLRHSDLGSVELTSSDSEPFVVDVPPEAASIAFVLNETGDVATQPATITNPDGEVVFEVGATSTNRVDAFRQVTTALVPVSPDVELSEGRWEFTFFSGSDTSANLQALMRIDEDVSSGTLDLNLHFVGLESLDSSTAAEDEAFQAILDRVKTIYSDAGITIGEVAYYEVEDLQYSVLTTGAVASEEMLDLLKTVTPDRDNRAVNLFFVADIENPGSNRSLLGVSGGVPGPGPLHGTERSGVAVNMANYLAAVDGAGDLPSAQDEIALIIAHELGHYLGLFHTTEANGLELGGEDAINGQDPLEQTALCPDDADEDGDGVLSPLECEDADAGNLMFWSPPNGATSLTAAQSEVIRRNPVVR